MNQGDKEVEPVAQASEPGQHGSPATVADLTHEIVRNQLNDALEGTLDQRDRERLESHLATCGPCRAFGRTLNKTVEALGNLPPAKMPESARERLLQRMAEAP